MLRLTAAVLWYENLSKLLSKSLSTTSYQNWNETLKLVMHRQPHSNQDWCSKWWRMCTHFRVVLCSKQNLWFKNYSKIQAARRATLIMIRRMREELESADQRLWLIGFASGSWSLTRPVRGGSTSCVDRFISSSCCRRANLLWVESTQALRQILTNLNASGCVCIASRCFLVSCVRHAASSRQPG